MNAAFKQELNKKNLCNIIGTESREFIRLVTEGEQDAIQDQLQNNRHLVNCKASIIDLSGRAFTEITGLQYSLWALDWHMYQMLLTYLTQDEAIEQCNAMLNASWNVEHGEHVNWDKLINSLKKCITLQNNGDWEESNRVWVEEVGNAQLDLPVHVVNEYCHPTRSMDPVPNFEDESCLPRSRNIQYYDKGWKDAGELFNCTVPNQSIGKSLALGRGGWMVRGVDSSAGLCPEPDLKSLISLYEIRKKQRIETIQVILHMQ